MGRKFSEQGINNISKSKKKAAKCRTIEGIERDRHKNTHSPMTIPVIRIIHEIPVLYDFTMGCVRNDARVRDEWIRKVAIINVHTCEDVKNTNEHAIAMLMIDECKSTMPIHLLLHTCIAHSYNLSFPANSSIEERSVLLLEGLDQPLSTVVVWNFCRSHLHSTNLGH